MPESNETGGLGPVHYAVAVYDQGRSYGGPEEGGWWFTYGELMLVHSFHSVEDDAWDLARRANEAYREAGDLTSEGGLCATVVQLPRYEVVPELRGQLCHLDYDLTDDDYVVEWGIPTSYPEGRPHYC